MKDFQIVIRPCLVVSKQPFPAAVRVGFGRRHAAGGERPSAGSGGSALTGGHQLSFHKRAGRHRPHIALCEPVILDLCLTACLPPFSLSIFFDSPSLPK